MRSTFGFIAAGALLLTPPATRPVTQAGTIEGLVQDSARRPLASAHIIAGNRSARTDSTGRYRLDSVPAGEILVTARALGYQAVSQRVMVAAGRVVRVDFMMKAFLHRLDEIVVSGKAVAGHREVASTVMSPPGPGGHARFNTEEYRAIVENAWRSAERHPLSTFSSDVDAGSYTNVRRFLSGGTLPPRDAVRVEEMINYFRYDYAAPDDDEPFSVTTELAESPWNANHKLVLIGLQTRRIPMEALPPNNLVFLLDVSGSMTPPNKLPLVKSAFRLLVDQLRPQDRVSIVVYAGASGLVLEPTPGSDKDRILAALGRLEAGGTTAGAAGLRLAYQTARGTFMRGGNNRVILATDGDFNVGVSSDGELTQLIESERDHGIALTVLGFGMGNLKDSKLELLADKGNGHYAYVDNLLEARKVFVQELGATLLTVAKDVKLQVEFNPSRVAAYRLVGYENRVLANEDFNDDTKDAGDLGAGHSVTAIYEILPAGHPVDVTLGSVDPLRYGKTESGRRRSSPDWLTVKIRYKSPAGGPSRLLSQVVRKEQKASANLRWASAVAGIGMLLRDSEHKGSCTWPDMLTLARGAIGDDREGYRAEFLRLAETAHALAMAVSGKEQ
jgi:Ca-activated chloride channel family protein